MLRRILVSGFVILNAGCAMHRVGPGTDQNADIISRQAILATGEPVMYGVIAKLHAEYLRDRGKTSVTMDSRDVAVVFLDNQEYGPIATLRQVPAPGIAEVRYYRGNDAVIKFGKGYGGGVIQLISRVD